MTAYSHKAQLARAFLQRHANDLDVFVEDTTCQNMYVRLFNRFLRGRGRISAVYPLGNRRQVLEACARDQAPRPRGRLYVVDGDLELLTGQRIPQLRHLYRLRVYCIENLLLAEEGFLEIATEGCPNDPREDLARRLDLPALLSRLGNVFIPLFVLFAVVHLLKLPIPTVSRRVFRFFDDANDLDTLSEQRVRAEIKDVLRSILALVSRARYRTAKRRIRGHLRRAKIPAIDFISGKDYLMPILHRRLNEICRLRYSTDALKVRLAMHSALDVDADLGRRLRRVARAVGAA